MSISSISTFIPKDAAASGSRLKQDGYDSETEISHQRATQGHFLRERAPAWKYTSTRKDISVSMLKARAQGQEQSINLTGVPARVVLIAESSLHPILFQEHPKTGDYYRKTQVKNLNGLTARESISMSNKDGTAFFAGMSYRQSSNNIHVNHAGNYFFKDLGTYPEICEKLKSLKQKMRLPAGTDLKEKDKKIATFLLGYGKTLYAFRTQDVEAALCIPNFPIEELKFIEPLCYNLFVKEIARRLHPRDTETHDLPFAASLVRALRLVEAGHVSLEDVLHPEGKLATFTISKVGININQAREHIKRINRLYRQHFPEQSEHPLRFKRELAEIFGGASDSEDEGYLSISTSAFTASAAASAGPLTTPPVTASAAASAGPLTTPPVTTNTVANTDLIHKKIALNEENESNHTSYTVVGLKL